MKIEILIVKTPDGKTVIDQRTTEEVETTRPWNSAESKSVYKTDIEPGQVFMLEGTSYILNHEYIVEML
jgi:hypothetical protein